MNVLDSHVEALAFNYVRFGFFTIVNNIWTWTWVAVVTAAVSFWRFRTAGSVSLSPSCPLKSDSPHKNADGSLPELNLTPSDSTVEPPSTTAASTSTSETAVLSVCDCNVKGACGVTKERFTVYYGEDSECGSRLTVAEGWDNGGYDVSGVGGELFEGLEKAVRMRMGDHMGWYSFQDLTVLNGNVVKLWDGCRMRSSSTLECVKW